MPRFPHGQVVTAGTFALAELRSAGVLPGALPLGGGAAPSPRIEQEVPPAKASLE